MSLPPRVVALDADVISNFHKAGKLRWLLELAIATFVLTAEAQREIELWPGEGKEASAILREAIERGMIQRAFLESQEFALYINLRERLGSGEAACVAIAIRRGYAVATDDRTARKLCRACNPPVDTFRTEDFLQQAIATGQCARDEAERIWKGMNIADPTRGVV